MTRRQKIVLALALLAMAGTATAVAVLVQHGFSARDQPTAVEAFVARRLRHLAVSRSARQVQNPVPATPEVLAEARAHFADHCALCHGNDGSGQTEIGKKRFIVVGVMAICVVLASAGYVQAFGGHGGGHGGHFGGHFGGHGFHGEHFGGHFGGHGFHGEHFGHFGPFPHGGIFPHPGGFPHGFGHGGFFPHHGGGFFAPFAFRAGPPVAIIRDPFFCFPHGLGFTAQDAFLAHLQDLHGISPGHAPAHLIQTGERFIFLDF